MTPRDSCLPPRPGAAPAIEDALVYRAFVPSDITAALALWRATPNIGLSASDTKAGLEQFLARNPSISEVAVAAGVLVGTILCGHDGRRGYIHHLAVRKEARQRRIGSTLTENVLGKLAVMGILKCHAFVLNGNEFAELFWQPQGWQRREDFTSYSKFTPVEDASAGVEACDD